MKPLATTQLVFTWFCLCPADATATKSQKIAHKITAFAAVIAIISVLVMSVIYYWQFMRIDLEESFYALYQICGDINLLYMFVVAYFSRSKINATFNKLSNILSASESNSD